MAQAKGSSAVSAAERSRRYVREIWLELKKVVWPTPKQTLSYTGFVVFSTVFVALVTMGLDALFNLGLTHLR